MFNLFAAIFLSQMLYAHPVTFEDGVMLKSMAREDMSESSVTYTFSPRFAVGVEYDRLQMGTLDSSWGLLEFNSLLKRWNGEHSQGNVYLLSGAGTYWDNQDSTSWGSQWGAKWGLQADYETRQFYTLGSYTGWHTEDLETYYALFRFGYAPFLAGYNDLNIWVIAQFDYNPDMRSEVQVTPFLRFFYKNILWEMGASLRGNVYWQFMVHI
jgi:hypothetical protein